MEFNPDTLNYAELETRRRSLNLCGACRHREVCPVPRALEKRAGVCQDFAHIMIACLRAMGIPGRYVSGYLLTQPPPGTVKLQGSDASHSSPPPANSGLA